MLMVSLALALFWASSIFLITLGIVNVAMRPIMPKAISNSVRVKAMLLLYFTLRLEA
jgi:hypothetical protein